MASKVCQEWRQLWVKPMLSTNPWTMHIQQTGCYCCQCRRQGGGQQGLFAPGPQCKGAPDSDEHIQIHILFSGFRSKSTTYRPSLVVKCVLKFGSEQDKRDAKKAAWLEINNTAKRPLVFPVSLLFFMLRSVRVYVSCLDANFNAHFILRDYCVVHY